MKTPTILVSLLVICLIITGCSQVSQSPIKDNFAEWSFYSEDPDAKQQDTWKIEDGILKCSGTPRGYLYTNDSYTDFTMTLQWRWPDKKSEGKGGVLIDMSGENKIWPKSLEAQINAGGAGDFWALDRYKITGAPERTKTLNHPQYGNLINIVKMEAAEKPAGQWNFYKIIAKGSDVTLIINGKIVNKAKRTKTSGGKLCITSEGTGIEFRDIKIFRN